MLCDTEEFLSVTDYEVMSGKPYIVDKDLLTFQWDLKKHKDGEIVAEFNAILSMEDSIAFKIKLDEAFNLRLQWHDYIFPEGWTNVRSFLLYDAYYKNVLPGTYTIEQAENAIEKMNKNNMIPPKAYEYVAQNHGWGTIHEDNNHPGSDVLSKNDREREVKKGFEKIKNSGHYKANKLKNKMGNDLIVYIAEKTFVAEYFFPAGVWEKHVTKDDLISITPFPKIKGNYWYKNFGKIFVMNKNYQKINE